MRKQPKVSICLGDCMSRRKRDSVLKNACVLICLVWSCMALSQETNPWPQFRGPNGLGHSNASNLPVHWDADSQNIRWKTVLPGEGLSSPVISNERVFVTTAYDAPQSANLSKKITFIGSMLLVIACVGWLWRQIRMARLNKKQLPSAWPSDTEAWIVEILSSIILFLFLFFAAGVTLFPARFDRWLDLVGIGVAKFYPDLLKIVTIEPAVEAGIWLTGGAIALIGMATAMTVLRGIIWRMLILGVMIWGSWYLHKHTPLDEWYEKIESIERWLFTFPGLILGTWALLTSVRIHKAKSDTEYKAKWLDSLNQFQISLRYPKWWHPGEYSSVIPAFTILLLSALIFIPGNYLLGDKGVTRSVLAVDLKSGNILWETPVWTDTTERKHSDNSYATPTCATDGQHVLAFFGGILVCLDQEGQVLWQLKDEQFIKNAKYGNSCSPIIVDGLAVVLQGKERSGQSPAWLGAFDIHTGEERWRIYPQELGEGYATVLAHRHPSGVVQLFVHSEYLLNAYDLSNGRLLWSMPSPIDQIVASLVVSDSTLVVGGGTYGPKALFALTLSDHVNRRPRIKWQTDVGTPECCSPVIIENRLYTLTDRGHLTCFNLNTSTVLWEQRLQGRHLASLVTGDGKLYAVNTKGRTSVLDANSSDKSNILATNQIRGKCHATPALAPDCIIQRIDNFLICIHAKK